MTTLRDARRKMPDTIPLARGAVALGPDSQLVYNLPDEAHFDAAAAAAVGRGLPMEKAEERAPSPAEPPAGSLPLYDLHLVRSKAEGAVPPAAVREAARRGLELRREHGRGGTEVGVARARDLSNGRRIPPETLKRMTSYFSRHEVDKQGKGWSPGEEGYPSAGRIAWLLWGGDAGWSWARGQLRGSEGRKALTKAEAHSGAMVAIMAPLEVRAALDKAGMLDLPGAPEDLHITLLYLGPAAEISSSTRKRIVTAINDAAASVPPLDLRIGGVGRFAKGPDGVPVYASATGPGLSRLQAALEEAVGEIVDLPSEHGWVPHMTLGYLSDGGRMPEAPGTDPYRGGIPDLPGWTANKVRLQLAGEAALDAPLSGKAASRAMAKADESRVVYYIVTPPHERDAHGEGEAEDSIAEACWGFAKRFKVKLEHGRPEAMKRWRAAWACDSKGYLRGAEVVENYLTYSDLREGVDTFHGAPANQDIPAGTHIAAIRYPEEVWPEFRDTDDHGLSWGGEAAEVEAR